MGFLYVVAVCVQKSYEQHQQEDPEGCSSFSQGLSFAMSETTQDLLTGLHQSLPSEDPVASDSWASEVMAQWDASLFPPVCSSICTTRLQEISGSSVTSSPTCSIKSTSAPSDTTSKSSPKAQSKTDDACIQRASAWLDHCEGNLETCRASSGLPSAAEPGAAFTAGEEFEMLLYLCKETILSLSPLCRHMVNSSQ